MADALTSGERVGSYEVIGRLGAGGMGEVFRARDTRLGRSALNHPNIVHSYDVGEAAGRAGAHYVVMELVEGETLRRRLRPSPLPMLELLDVGAQLADGLAPAQRALLISRAQLDDSASHLIRERPRGRAVPRRGRSLGRCEAVHGRGAGRT